MSAALVVLIACLVAYLTVTGRDIQGVDRPETPSPLPAAPVER